METPESIERPQLIGAIAPGNWLEVLAVFTRLGLTSFGGPVAHLGYFRSEFVTRRRWLDDATYADLVALCQFLPGPASSQVGLALGLLRAGLLGGAAAWVGFTLPSAMALTLFAFGVHAIGGAAGLGALHGLQVVAVAVVAQAVWGMAPRLCPDRTRATLGTLAAVAALLLPAGPVPVAIIASAALIGRRWLAAATADEAPPLGTPISRGWATVALALFFVMLVLLPLLRTAVNAPALALVDSFYRAGALVFGGGHVVLPLLQAEVGPPGWVSEADFIAGYGAAQAVPGPLFTFAAYLGAIASVGPGGWLGATLCLFAIYLPAWLLVFGALPFWDQLRRRADFAGALRGANAAVVGLLGAALYQPVWTSAITSTADVALALVAFGLLQFWSAPPWLVVVLAALAGAVLGLRA